MSSIDNLRSEICALNIDLQKYKLVSWTAGNVSQRLPSGDKFIIKPSGVMYEDLLPEKMVICTLEGKVIEGDLSPSSDVDSHAYIYRNLPDVNGVVHTHSHYASAWAAAHLAIPCVLTAMADEFGGDIPLGPFALIGDDSIGKAIVETLRDSRSTAVLMKNHGVFTIGKSGKAALKSAVMCEDVAKTIWLAKALGPLERLAQSDIDSLYLRYQNIYGQTGGKN